MKRINEVSDLNDLFSAVGIIDFEEMENFNEKEFILKNKKRSFFTAS